MKIFTRFAAGVIAAISIAGFVVHAQQGAGLSAAEKQRRWDIEHELHVLEGDIYGAVALILRRPMPLAGLAAILKDSHA